jgi:hypothetical protein
MINKKEFLKEYEILCKKYNITINSCGCCDSPWLTDSCDGKGDFDKYLEEHIKHLNKK